LPEEDVLKLGKEVQQLRIYLSMSTHGDPATAPVPADMEEYGFGRSSDLLRLASAVSYIRLQPEQCGVKGSCAMPTSVVDTLDMVLRHQSDTERGPLRDDADRQMAINCFTLSSPSLTPIGIAMSPSVALFNHSCRPNAVVVFPQGSKHMAVVAIADIREGEEVLTSYIDVSLPRHLRRQDLKKRYGFDCDCSLCRAPLDPASGSGDLSDGLIKLVSSAEELLRKDQFGMLGEPKNHLHFTDE
jgi:SET and MYND domain-containing protein